MKYLLCIIARLNMLFFDLTFISHSGLINITKLCCISFTFHHVVMVL